jgi:hypothetical protein
MITSRTCYEVKVRNPAFCGNSSNISTHYALAPSIREAIDLVISKYPHTIAISAIELGTCLFLELEKK